MLVVEVLCPVLRVMSLKCMWQDIQVESSLKCFLVLYDFIGMLKLRGSGWVCISTMGPIPRVQVLLCPYLEIFFS